MQPTNPLFEKFTLVPGIVLRNRIAMAPMTTWSGNPDGTVSDQEEAYYRARAKGVGLVITGCTHVSASGVGFTDEFAAHDDRFIPSLRRLAQAAKSGGAPAILQIFHAGDKAVPALVPGGEIVSASDGVTAASVFAASQAYRALTVSEIGDIVADFGEATRRAIEAGFDGVELHGAHGFLLQNFLSPRDNRRTDAWGGALEGRMRFPLAVVREVKRAIAEHARRPFVLGYRFSPEEPGDGGLRLEEVQVLIDHLVEAGVDYVHASLASVLDARPIDATDDKTIAARVLAHVADRVPVIAAGGIRTPDQAGRALDLGLPLIAVGQGLVMNPDWVELARTGRADQIDTALSPSKVSQLSLPAKLWSVIQATTGWFTLRDEPRAVASGA